MSTTLQLWDLCKKTKYLKFSPHPVCQITSDGDEEYKKPLLVLAMSLIPPSPCALIVPSWSLGHRFIGTSVTFHNNGHIFFAPHRATHEFSVCN